MSVQGQASSQESFNPADPTEWLPGFEAQAICELAGNNAITQWDPEGINSRILQVWRHLRREGRCTSETRPEWVRLGLLPWISRARGGPAEGGLIGNSWLTHAEQHWMSAALTPGVERFETAVLTRLWLGPSPHDLSRPPRLSVARWGAVTEAGAFERQDWPSEWPSVWTPRPGRSPNGDWNNTTTFRQAWKMGLRPGRGPDWQQAWVIPESHLWSPAPGERPVSGAPAVSTEALRGLIIGIGYGSADLDIWSAAAADQAGDEVHAAWAHTPEGRAILRLAGIYIS